MARAGRQGHVWHYLHTVSLAEKPICPPKSDESGVKSDIPLLMSGVGGKAEVDFGELNVCL